MLKLMIDLAQSPAYKGFMTNTNSLESLGDREEQESGDDGYVADMTWEERRAERDDAFISEARGCAYGPDEE